MIEFDRLCKQTNEMIQLLTTNINAFNWSDFGGKGNPCWDPHIFECSEERKADALMLAAVKFCIPHGSQTHAFFTKEIAKQVGCKYITYPWLTQAIAYILTGISYSELEHMTALANAVQLGMKKNGLDQIDSILEALALE